MGWVKRVVFGVGALVMVSAGALVATVALVDPNDYKPMLQQAVKERYNRTLLIDGDLRLSLLPRLGLEISGVSLSEPGSTQTFAAMDSARMAVAWWPLLSRNLVIEYLTVSGIKANLVVDKTGHFNFQDLLEGEPEPIEATPTRTAEGRLALGLDWNIKGVTLEGGEVAVTDARTGTSFRIERVAAQAKGLALGSPFDLSLSGRVLGQQPRTDASLQVQGRFTLLPDTGRYQATGLELRLDGVLPSVKANTLALRGNLSLDVNASTVAARDAAFILQGDVALAAPLQNLDFQVHAPQVFYQWSKGTVALDNGSIQARGLLDGQAFFATVNAPRVRLGGTDTPSEPVRLSFQRDGQGALSLQANVEGLKGTSEQIQAERLAVQGEWALPEQRRVGWELATSASWQMAKTRLRLDNFAATATLRGEGLPEAGVVVPITAKLDAPLSEQRVVAQGEIKLEDQAVSWSVRGQDLDTDPGWQVRLEGGMLDFDRLWPAAAQAVSTAPARPVATVGPNEGKLDLWDPSWLTNRRLQLEAAFTGLRLRGVEASQARVVLSVDEGKAILKNLQARLYQGTLQASGEAQAIDAKLALKAQLRNVDIQPLLQAVANTGKLSGRGNLDVMLNTQGKTEADLRQHLSGNVRLQLRDGAVQGMNVAQTLREFRSMLGSREDATQAADKSRQTDFSEFRVQGDIDQGLMTLKTVALSAPLLRVTQGEPAQINLVNETYDLTVQATVVNTATGQDGKALEQLRGISIPIHLSGPLDAPQYSVRWSAVGSQALKQVLQQEAGRQIDRLLGGQGSESTGRAIGDALKGILSR